MITYTFTALNGDQQVIIKVELDYSLDVKAMKLEVGETSTLENDVAPNYALELAKCQTSTADSTDTYANKGNIVNTRNLEIALMNKADVNKAVPFAYETTVTDANYLSEGVISAYNLTNAPIANNHLFYRTFSYDANNAYVVQEATLNGTTRKFIRYKNAGTWSAWQEFATISAVPKMSLSGTTLTITL